MPTFYARCVCRRKQWCNIFSCCYIFDLCTAVLWKRGATRICSMLTLLSPSSLLWIFSIILLLFQTYFLSIWAHWYGYLPSNSRRLWHPHLRRDVAWVLCNINLVCNGVFPVEWPTHSNPVNFSGFGADNEARWRWTPCSDVLCIWKKKAYLKSNSLRCFEFLHQ